MRKSWDENRALLEALSGLLLRLDCHGVILDFQVAQTLQAVFPVSEILIGKSIQEIFPSEFLTQVNESYKQFLETGPPQSFTHAFRSDDIRFDFEVNVVASEENNVLVVMRGITERKTLDSGLRLYEFISDSATEILTVLDKHYRHQIVNEMFCQVHNKLREEIIGKTLTDMGGHGIFNKLKPRIDACFSGEESSFAGWHYWKGLGRWFFEVHLFPFFFNQQVTHAVFVARDLTETRLAQEQLTLYNERLKIMSEIDHAILATQSPEDIAQEALKQIYRLVPYAQAGVMMFDHHKKETVVIARSMGGETIQGEDRLPFVGHEYLQSSDLPQSPQLTGISEPGDKLEPLEKLMLESGVQSHFTLQLIAEKKLIGAIILGAMTPEGFSREHLEIAKGIGRQLALAINKALLFEEVRSGRERLRHLTERLVSAQEVERKRISLELHDATGQVMTAIKLRLAVIQAKLPSNCEDVSKTVNEALLLTESAMDQIRTLAHGLRPPGLDSVGLNQTIADYCNQFTQQTDIRTYYKGEELVELPNHYQIGLYRIMQAALNNVIKHAKASEVEINLSYKNEAVNLQIKDNGEGFSYQQQMANPSLAGIGLLGMEERADTLGGTFEIVTQPGMGTGILVCIPWRRET